MRIPTLGCVGVGWIGRHRMAAIQASGLARIAAIVEPDDAAAQAALAIAPEAMRMPDLDALLALAPDGIVIATPSAQHAAEAQAALRAGIAVFCQKPLGRSAVETEAVLAEARRADRLLAVDLSYRHTVAMRHLRDLLGDGVIGRPFAIECVFHNAYGPDKPWFRDPVLSGGGCLIDLGIHLVDLALWCLDFPTIARTDAALFTGPARWRSGSNQVEDFASATLHLAGGVVVRLACSWNLHAGQDADIAFLVHGSDGGLAFRNVAGSFHDFTLAHHVGTGSRMLVTPPDDWGAGAALAWVRQLAGSASFDPAAERLLAVAAALDGIYAAD